MATMETYYQDQTRQKPVGGLAPTPTSTLTGATAASVTPASGSNSFESAYQNYANSGRGQTISGMYDAQRNAELAGLKSAYDQNLSDMEYARNQIGGAYQQGANTLQSEFERNRRNLNTQAAASGINTGAASQQRLALNSMYQRDYGNLRGQEAQAVTDAERAMADLKVTYQNAIQQANAEGDYKKMAALLDDYNTQYNTMLQQAQTLAAYGDFSGFSAIPGYTSEQIASMRQGWIAQNPLLAYRTGAISAAEYKRMTGKNAPGVGGGGGYYGGGRSGKGGNNNITGVQGTGIGGPGTGGGSGWTTANPGSSGTSKSKIATVAVPGQGRVPVNFHTQDFA